ncbi:hypothetical protein [Saccharothrix syringae]|uniref:Uncharacterized protein n=1 Tax=Saccharothrix syringae TaxID=103733 RepID=A0A5Q0H2T9_SACSY|nr:hypothetical protein [Saccharothrix syringae]QFZ20194.1 hypothetical protein EKG83_24765 [Saccharothrix syringae]
MDRTRLGAWAVVALVVVQAVVTWAFVRPTELTATGLLLNAAAGVSAGWLLLRPARNRWPLTAWAAGFFGWHAIGLVTLAGLVSTGLDAVFAVGWPREALVGYQAVLTTLAGFAVHLLLPRPRTG